LGGDAALARVSAVPDRAPDHKALAKAAETGSEVAIDAVLHGEKHASENT
jgi:hypothetical protein